MTMSCICLNLIKLRYITLRYVTLRYVTLCYVTLRYVMLYMYTNKSAENLKFPMVCLDYYLGQTLTIADQTEALLMPNSY